jgi:hypothetical protein
MQKPPGKKNKTDLTLTGLLMEGLGPEFWAGRRESRLAQSGCGIACTENM